MQYLMRFFVIAVVVGWSALVAASETAPASAPVPAPVFKAADRAVSTWHAEAAASLDLAPDVAADLLAGKDRPVARCVKLNNYWCIKKAGWAGEIAADSEGHVAFSTAAEGAAVAALLLKRYYVDFNRKTAMAIISRWAPAQCSASSTGARLAGPKRSVSAGLGNTLRARWLAAHPRGFVTPAKGVSKSAARPRRSVIADHMPKLMSVPSIALGLGEKDRPMKPTTLDALMQSSPDAPRSRSMLGMPSGSTSMPLTSCAGDSVRIAAYAAKAAAGIAPGPDGDLGLFDAAGTPTDNLATMMANMARVEIGPMTAKRALIDAGITDAFKPGRNPS